VEVDLRARKTWKTTKESTQTPVTGWGLHAKVAESCNSIMHQSHGTSHLKAAVYRRHKRPGKGELTKNHIVSLSAKENVSPGPTDDQIVAVSHHR